MSRAKVPEFLGLKILTLWWISQQGKHHIWAGATAAAVARNNTDEVLEVRVYRNVAPEGQSDLVARVKPRQTKGIKATKFLDDTMDGGLARVIRVETQNGYVVCRLSAPDFIWNIKFTFEIVNGQFIVTRDRNDQRITTELIRTLPTTWLREFVRNITTREAD
ncbi:hypothetical protein FF1_039807 [Malus domestica]